MMYKILKFKMISFFHLLKIIKIKIGKLLNNKTYGQNNYLIKNKKANPIINIKITQYFL